ncbi:MAG: PRC-barrel domain-containing protein [Pseudomonadota bacterium]
MDFQASNLTNHQTQHHHPNIHLSTTSIFASDSLIGRQILSDTGEILGHIKEVMMNIITGKLCYAVLSSQLDTKLFAIPWDAILYDVNQKIFLINMSAAKFGLAPTFDETKWPKMDDESWADPIHAFFGIPMKRTNSFHSAM